MQILIAGDSFAADWTVKYPKGKGWPNLLAEHHDVTNVAQAGVGEYKIYQQVVNQTPTLYDLAIISHTSPYRIHTRKHPVHHDDILHQHADLAMTDIEYHAKRIKGWFNSALWSADLFFRHHFDSQYCEDIYWLLRNAIHQQLDGRRCLIIDNFISPSFFQSVDAEISDFSQLQREFPGKHNHLSDVGNQKVYDVLQSKISR